MYGDGNAHARSSARVLDEPGAGFGKRWESESKGKGKAGILRGRRNLYNSNVVEERRV
jgi:hypothetical protein